MARRSYQESCRELERLRWIDKGSAPSEPLPHRPLHDDEKLGISFFRMRVAGAVIRDLTIPRTFFGRSEITQSSFRNTDLRESTLCWNDFIDVDFSDACLADSDLRASQFERVKFDGTDLRGADMRQSSFVDCTFAFANMTGAKLTWARSESLALSKAQEETIEWCADDGEEPGGG